MSADTADTAVATQKAPASNGFGLIAWLRWIWRQLTSMRTALVLLFLLALASIPGSVLPQQGIDPAAVTQYYAAHPSLAPFLARLSAFDVFGAPWFAAIYLLLFTSLAGCVLPRAFRLARSSRQPPPKAPRHLGRLPQSTSLRSALPAQAALESATGMLGRRRFRLRTGDGWVSAEKGYLHEIGNLLFHVALLGLLGSVALGGLLGYKGNKLLVEGNSVADTPTALDVFHPGRLVAANDLAPFSLTLEHFSARYITSGTQRGEPATFKAQIRYSSQYGGPQHKYDLQVNHPLNVDGVQVFLIGHGYAPTFKVTDGSGHVVLNQPVPFIPVEETGFTSEGVIKVPDASPKELGFTGFFLPTEYVTATGQLASAFPAAKLPRVSVVSYAGNLGLDSGQPQSVYSLNTSHLSRLNATTQPLAPGQSITLPHHLGKLTFTGYRQWASLAITYDPGQYPALISALAALAGLVMSFLVRRRRVFVRVRPADGEASGSVIEIGGLTRSDAAGGFEVELAELTAEFGAALGGVDPVPARQEASPPDQVAESTVVESTVVESTVVESTVVESTGTDEVALAKSKGE